MKTNVIRYKVAKAIVKMQNSELAESVRNYLEKHERLHTTICGALTAIAATLSILLIVG